MPVGTLVLNTPYTSTNPLNLGTLVLSAGAAVTRHHLYRDRGYRQTCAVVEPHPGRPGELVLRNLTGVTWTVVPEGEPAKPVAPGVRLGVRPMRIDFGDARGRIVAGSPG